MEKLLAKSGLFVTARNLNILQDLLLRNLTRSIESLAPTPGLAIEYDTDGALNTNWQIEDMGSGNIRVKAGIAVLPNLEVIELVSDSDNMAVTADDTTYYVVVTQSDYEKELGTVAVATSSLAIVGTGTYFEDEFTVGERILLDASNAANQVPLIIDTITDNTHLTVSATDGDGTAVALTTESGIEYWSIGRFAASYPSGADDDHLRNHNSVEIAIDDDPGTTYSDGNYLTLGTVVNDSGSPGDLTITDSRESNLLELFTNNRNSRTSDQNIANDTVKAQRYGGNTVWWEGVTNGTTAVTIDTSIDWRDRWITIQGWVSAASATPATLRPATAAYSALSIDDSGAIETDESMKYIAGMLFTGAASGYMTLKNGGDVIQLYADNADSGKLKLVKDANTSNQHAISLKIDYSPKQNHS